ncbi:NAD(P)/FAD-dependent oxidoreductase [uncultured Fusobacterium sp.]|jgi:thioredoxin reductase (NADPH)|uniref:NAD(P)/FAD-dependent oxidoreductase n=1 Tax=uncultured Fusobacterium sp. TaxID=159267 RepID=UPI0025911E36|nr:NAD(P)/FAD-dependent oxidoreductase [uncultured Fusobacterium sp.]
MGKDKIYDIVIVGGGPAGLTAALYTSRSKLSTLVVEKEKMGSLYMAHKIDNYPGFPDGISGTDLNILMKKQSAKFGTEFVDAMLFGFDPYEEIKVVKTDKGNFKCKNIIVATGTGKNFGKKLKGEQEFLGRGVSYCATCDGAFTKNRIVSLAGQGEEVAQEALFLTKFSKEIQIFINEPNFNCSEESLEALKKSDKVKIITNAKLQEILGDDFVEEITVDVDGNIQNYKTDFIFLYLGTKNNTEMYGEFANLDQHSNIITKENLKLNVDGMYAAGDIRSGVVRQITTAVADGTIAGLEVIKRVLRK